MRFIVRVEDAGLWVDAESTCPTGMRETLVVFRLLEQYDAAQFENRSNAGSKFANSLLFRRPNTIVDRYTPLCPCQPDLVVKVR